MPTIRGYRGEVGDVRALVDRVRGLPIQLMRADRVFGAEHLAHAAALAGRAVEAGRARSADHPTETLLYAAGERQVHKAITALGLHHDSREIAAVAWDAAALDQLAEKSGWIRDDAVLVGDERVLDALGISPQERAFLPSARWVELVFERVALVDVQKA